MALYKKFAAAPLRTPKPLVLEVKRDDKRTFDMRPKLDDYNRRVDPRDRPLRQPEPRPNLEPLDADPGE